MSDRLSKKEIKRDELAVAVHKAQEYASSHKPVMKAVGIGLAVVVLAAIGWSLFGGTDSEAAAKALGDAIEIYDAQVDAANPKPDDPKAPVFASEAARRSRAKEHFEKIRREHGGSNAAMVAAVFLGRIAADEGDAATARKLWQEFLDDAPADHILTAQTRVNLLRLDLAQGNKEDVLKRLEGMLAETRKPLPEDVLLFEIGTVREALGKKDEALSAFQRIVDEFPGSAYQRDAQLKANALAGDKTPT
ncbi:MAG TPA: tetratricopeptide repeat protein [Thermoanaerobaculia bacterium]|nr:tetratricopeptide repeat protein [Thermoanaerobaculia bacterium]